MKTLENSSVARTIGLVVGAGVIAALLVIAPLLALIAVIACALAGAAIYTWARDRDRVDPDLEGQGAPARLAIVTPIRPELDLTGSRLIG